MFQGPENRLALVNHEKWDHECTWKIRKINTREAKDKPSRDFPVTNLGDEE